MADPKYIYFAGYKVPIETEAAVITYRDPEAIQFYLPELIADPVALEKGLKLQSMKHPGTEFEDDEEGLRWKQLWEEALKKKAEEDARKKAEEDALKAAAAAGGAAAPAADGAAPADGAAAAPAADGAAPAADAAATRPPKKSAS